MNVSAWAIRHPIPPILLFALLVVVGLASFKALKIQNYPDVTIPIVTITASLPGATPSQLEAEVTRKIEDRVASIGAVNHISSVISDEVSVTTVDMDLDVDPQVALSDVRDAVASVRSLLPAGITEPIISRYSITATPILTYLVDAPGMDELDLSWFIDDTLSRELLTVKDVEKVQRQGGVDREVRVELDPAKLLALNTTASDVSLRLHNVQQEASGGRVDVGTSQQVVRAIGTVATADQLSRLVIPLEGRIARLSEVASVRDGPAERRQIALYDGKPVVGFNVYRSAASSEVVVAEQVRRVIARLAVEHPGVKIREISNTVKAVKDTFDVSMWALYEGAIFAVLVVWLFLRDVRATIVSAAALPLSIIPAFAAMHYLGFSLNTVTLLALTLVVGILVDDAIVEVENIVRHLRSGRSAREAALEASNEIGMAVIATTFTLVAVFLPTAFMGGMAGQFFKQFGWTASVAVLASLLVARLLTPMMAAAFLKPGGEHPPEGRIMQRYLRTAEWCLAHPRITVGLAAAFLAASFSMIAALSTSFMPAEDSNRIFVAIETPPGNSLEGTTRVMEAVRRTATGMKEIVHVYGVIDGDARRASMAFDLVPRKQRKGSQTQIEEELRERLQAIPAARFSIGSETSGAKMSFTLVGDDPARLESAAHRVVGEIRGIPGLGNVSSTVDLLRPEVHIVPDFARAADLGVTAAAIGQAVRVATIGDYDASLPKLNLPDRQLPIRVQLSPAARADLQTIAQLRVPGNKGTVPLENVANISVASGPSQITRFDRLRNVTIDVELGNRVLGDVTQRIAALPSMNQLPEGVRRAQSGDAEKLKEMMSGFGMAMGAGILCVYLVLVLLFDDFLQPVTILAALPLAVGGALGVLVVLGYSMSMSALIGLLMLMGIVTKNSILLVEYAITARKSGGMARTEAIVDACRKRARPIVMTTCAMIAGMVPLALGLEGESSFRGPMAVVVIGGLLTSTALSLLVVPVVYELIDDFEQWVKRLLGKTKAAPIEEARESV